MESFNNEILSDFFVLVDSENKKKVENNIEEEKKKKDIIGEVSLDGLFASISEEKKKVKKKNKEIIGDISLDDLFSSLSEEKKKTKEIEINKKQELEQLKKEAKVFESFLFDENQKEEEKPPKPTKIKRKSSKKATTTDKKEEKEEIKEKVDENLQKSIDILNKLVPKEERIDESETEISILKREVDQLRKMVYETVRTAAAQGGGGEVRLEFLDDVDRDSAKVNDKVLKYQTSTGKWVGADAGSVVDLGPLTNIAAASTTSIDNGLTLVFDAASGQFIASTGSSGNATSIAGYAITGTPSGNDVLTFNEPGSVWEYDSPFTIVDLSDGVEDGHQDYGSFS